MTEFQAKPELESEAIVDLVREEMAKVFPDYKTVDRSRWDAYKPNQDEADNGRLLTFYCGEAEPSNPNIMFIFKKSGDFAVNFFNNPFCQESPSCICYRGDTVYKEPYCGDGQFWTLDDLDLATGYVRIWMDGLPLEKNVLGQPILDNQNQFVQFGDWLEEVLEYKVSHKTKDQEKERLALPNIFQIAKESPELIRQLVMARFESNLDGEFKIGERSYSYAEVLGEVHCRTDLGEKALDLEIARIAIHYESLWQLGVSRPGRIPELKLPD